MLMRLICASRTHRFDPYGMRPRALAELLAVLEARARVVAA